MQEKESRKPVVRTEVERCVGHARCAAVAPTIFNLDDDGYNVQPLRILEEDQVAEAMRGARACPEKIIRVDTD